jgi:hypothetical protein
MEMHYFGFVTRLHRISMTSDGTHDKEILLIIKACNTLGTTIRQYAPDTYMSIIRPWYYCKQPGLAL